MATIASVQSMVTRNTGVKFTQDVTICDIRPINRFILRTVNGEYASMLVSICLTRNWTNS